MDWPRALVIIERFGRMARMNLRELQLLLDINETSSPLDSKSKRDTSRKIDQLLDGLQQVLNVRSDLNIIDRERFDVHIEPIRIQIQGVINALNRIATIETSEKKNIYDDLYEKSLLEKRTEGDGLQEEKQKRINPLFLQTKEAKMNAVEIKKLACDIEDLNEMMIQLAQLVHTQHEVVDSIEEHVEKAQADVHRAHKNLKKTQAAQTAKYPMIAATVGSIAVGGPVGFVAGSAVAGIFAAFGGAIAGACSGKYFRQKAQETANQVDGN